MAYRSTNAETDEMFEDHYQALWVPRDASDDDIKRAYYALAQECHPDLHANEDAAKKKFQRIQRAIEILGDPEQREKYNQTYDARYRNIPTPVPPPPPPQSSSFRNSGEAKQIKKRPSAQGRSAVFVLRVVFGGIAGIVLGLLTLAIFFPDALWNEQADRNKPRRQREQTKRSDRRTQSDRAGEKVRESQQVTRGNHPEFLAEVPESPKRESFTSPGIVSANVPTNPETPGLPRGSTNTIGIRLVRIDAGEFIMGRAAHVDGTGYVSRTRMSALNELLQGWIFEQSS